MHFSHTTLPKILFSIISLVTFKNKIKFVYQDKHLGTGDAVLKAKKFITGSHFLMLFPDDLIMKKNCSKDMITIHKKFKCSVMASMKVKKNNVNRWGIYSVNKKINKQNFLIKDVIEKVFFHMILPL